MQRKSKDVVGDDERAIRWSQDECLVETVRRIVIGFQLASDHDAACLEIICAKIQYFSFT